MARLARAVTSDEQESREDSGEGRGAGGKKQTNGEGGNADHPTLMIKRAAHTSPVRLSAGSSEKMIPGTRHLALARSQARGESVA